ncbi:MAG: beta-lactamase family protein [Deltaproteobacteria bacterium]|nr:beta-lactamase family protein [Deltaproteobacteria bacterium]
MSTVRSTHVADGRADRPLLVKADAFAEVSAFLQRGVEEGVFPGCVLLVGKDGIEVFKQSYGVRATKFDTEDRPLEMTPDTVFDAASLTGVMATTTLVMRLVESGHLSLKDHVSRYIQGFGVYDKSGITVGHLLSHSSGLAHWHPYFEELLKVNTGERMGVLTSRGARDYVYNAVNRSSIKSKPGIQQTYSDLGLIVLGHMVEILTGLTLDRAAQRYVFQPLGMKNTSFIDLTLIRRRGIHPVRDLIAPTEECPWRRRVLCGEVHDDNAWAMGGIAGHSGVFTTVADLHLFAAEMLKAYRGRSNFLKAETLAEFWAETELTAEGGWRFGWESPSSENGLATCGLSASAVGHNGFTGCSLWIEPQKGIDIVFMSNRVHPSRANKKIRVLRPKLFEMVLKVLSGS